MPGLPSKISSLQTGHSRFEWIMPLFPRSPSHFQLAGILVGDDLSPPAMTAELSLNDLADGRDEPLGTRRAGIGRQERGVEISESDGELEFLLHVSLRMG